MVKYTIERKDINCKYYDNSELTVIDDENDDILKDKKIKADNDFEKYKADAINVTAELIMSIIVKSEIYFVNDDSMKTE